MKMHPAEIANELKDYYFFKIFKERFLLQICTMVDIKSYAHGDCILIEGQHNEHLYFLRSGTVELYKAGKKIAELSTQGEVMGEMSVITGNVASTTIVAQSEVDVFFIDTANFTYIKQNDREAFELLLYKMYCHILVDRLTKANTKKSKEIES